MKNLEVAKILNEIADLLEMKGVEFKPRAYRKAARTVRSLSRDIEDVKDEGQLTELPGIGESIAEKIIEIVDTGSLEYYQDLEKEFPIDYESLLAVEGLGPKTIKLLYRELDIKTLDDLEEAASEHRIRELGGMGEKTEKKILENIKYVREKTGRSLLGFALPVAKDFKSKLETLEVVDKIVIAGSIRRRKETIGDIDLLVTTKKPSEVMESFTHLDRVDQIVAEGEAKSTVRLKMGIEADLRVLDEESFGSGLMYFTGSKETNIEMRKIAMKKDLKLNEYGLFDGEQSIAGQTEKEVFKELGMEYIPPELRENRGEVEAALKGKIPKLIGYDELKGDLQMHTKWSDGSYTIEEMAEAGQEMGYDYIALTDHTGTLRIAGGMNEGEIRKQMKKIDEINQKMEGFTILKGVEVNIDSDGELDVEDEVLEGLDIVVASVHSGFRQGKEKITGRIISAMENENVDIIAHPTGRKVQQRKAYDLDFDKIFEASKRTGTFLEINSYPNRLDLNDINVKRAIDAGCKLVIDADSHSTEHLRYIEFGLATARRGWAKKEDIINTLPLEKLRKVLS
ncbi:MAG: DNA polymerase/3'-5' exonuclease PolX [Thermoproteota archaeon]